MEMQMTGAMGRGRSSGVGVAIRCISGEDESFGRSLFFVIRRCTRTVPVHLGRGSEEEEWA
jgi:hypothetical protein